MDTLVNLFADKSVKPKELTETINNIIVSGTLDIDTLISFAHTARPPVKATCIEALEYVTRLHHIRLTEPQLSWVIGCLAAKEPRVIWESAKVTCNVIAHHPALIAQATAALLPLTEHKGTVVRWSAAYALSSIITAFPVPDRIEMVKHISKNEEKSSIRKLYTAALKKAKAI